MQLNKKNAIFMAVGVAGALLVLLAAFLLFRGIGQLNKTAKRLDGALRSLRDLYDANPFPSAANVELEKENLKTVKHWYQELGRTLRKGQITPDNKSPSTFMGLLGETKNDLIKLAAKSGTTLPPQFAFGFDRYFAAGSTLPAPTDVGRLTQQLRMADRLCKALYDSRATSITSLQRIEFEGSASGKSGAANRQKSGVMGDTREDENATEEGNRKSDAGLLKPGDLYASFHFVVEFTGREQAVLSFLNQIAREEMYVVITSVRMEKDGSDVRTSLPMEKVEKKDESPVVEQKKPDARRRPGAAARAKEAAAPEAKVEKPAEKLAPEVLRELPRRERMMSGFDLEKPMKVRVELDVYSFPAE